MTRNQMRRGLVEKTSRGLEREKAARLVPVVSGISDVPEVPYTSDDKDFVMEISNFKDMYLAELQELVSVEDNFRRRCCAWRQQRPTRR